METREILNGKGTVVSLSPSPLTFSGTTVGITSASNTLAVKNTGKTTLSITGQSITGGYLLAGQTCTTSLAVGKSGSYSIRFKPTAKGASAGTFSLTDSGGGGSQKVTLTGIGK